MGQGFLVIQYTILFSWSKYRGNRWLRGGYPDHGPGGGGRATIGAHYHHQDIHSVLHAPRLAAAAVAVFTIAS